MNRRGFLCGAALAGFARTGAGQAPNSAASRPGGRLCAIHTMVDMPDWASNPGKRFDPQKFIRLCRQAHVEVIEFKCKNAVGDAMFPFRGRTCPRDWVTETRALAKQAGLEFIAYYNVGLDNRMARRRPEWRCIDPKGNAKIAFGAFNWMCIRSPWRDMVLDELRQMQEGLRADGVWFDLLGAPNAYGLGSFDPSQACFCRWCREAYQAHFGEQQPVSSDDPEIRLRVNRFGHAARLAMFRDASNLLRSLDPNLELGYNGAGNYDRLGGTPKELQDLVTYNSSEAKQHRLISFTAKTMWAMGKPFQVHTWGGFIRMQPGAASGTWAAWNLLPSSYLDVSAAVITAHAGRIGIGVNPLPDGTIYEDEFRNVGRTLGAISEREPWLAGLKSVPNVAVVYDAESELVLLPLPSAPRGGLPVRQEATGLHHALLDAGIHFDVVNAEALAPQNYCALLIGNAVCPSAGLRDALTKFVTAGGLLIATHETSLRDAKGRRLPDFAWSGLLGVRFTGVSPFQEANYGWLSDELRGDAPAYPVLFTSPVLEVECTTARPLAELVYPEAHRSPDVFTDGETPHTHFGKSTGKPLVTANRLGKGTVIYVAGPIGTEIASREDTWLKRMLAGAVKKYATGFAIQADAPPGIQVVFGRRGGVHVVSLVNHYAGMIIGGPHPQVGPVSLRIPESVFPSRPRTVRPIDAKGVRWRFAKGLLQIDVESVGHHALLVMECA